MATTVVLYDRHEPRDLFASHAAEVEASADPELHGISDEARAEQEEADAPRVACRSSIRRTPST